MTKLDHLFEHPELSFADILHFKQKLFLQDIVLE